MSEQFLSVRIGAETSGFEAGFARTVKSLQRLDEQLKVFKAGLASATNPARIATLNNAIAATKDRMNSIRSIGDPFKGVTTSGTRATHTLVDLSRVAQDMPYGFIGIANNINPLVESFQRLKDQSGGLKGALTAMGASLAGPAGIGVAVGVVSSLLVSFSGDLFGSKDATEAQTEALDRFAESLKKSREELDEMAEGIKRLQEIGELNLKIQGLPDGLGKAARVLDIDVMLLQAREGYDALIKKQDQFQQSIARMESLKFDLGKIPGAETYAKAPDWMKGMGGGSINPDAVINQIKGGLEKLEPEIKKAYDKITELEHQRKVAGLNVQVDIKESNDKAAADLKTSLEKQSKAWQDYINDLKAAHDALRSFARAREDFNQVPSLNRPDISSNFLAGQLEAEERGKDNLGILPSGNELAALVADQKRAADEAKQVWEKFNNDINKIMGDIQANMLVGLGEGLGKALSGGGAEDIFNGIFQAIGSAMQELGKAMIATGTGMAAIKAAFQSLNPVLAITGGVALVALGGAIKGSVGKIKTFAEGGVVYGPTMGLMGEYAGASSNPEVIAPLSKLKDIIQGSGGSRNINISGVLKVRGKDLVLAMAQNQRLQGITG